MNVTTQACFYCNISIPYQMYIVTISRTCVCTTASPYYSPFLTAFHNFTNPICLKVFWEHIREAS